METENLPIILISALDDHAAWSIISGIDKTEEKIKTNGKSMGKIWKIQNKYYTVNVLMQPLLDGNKFEDSKIEAHVIYLIENECDSVICQSRYNIVEKSINDNMVKLIAAQCEVVPDSVTEWAQDFHYEVVPLLECSTESEEDDPFPELYGMDRLRDALHLHEWPGLTRLDKPNTLSTIPSEESDEAAMRRAEEFIETFAVLPAIMDLPLAERRQKAEEVVLAFCKALDQNLFIDDIVDN